MTVKIVRGVGVGPAVIVEVDSKKDDAKQRGKAFALYMVSHTSWKFCEGFAEAWQEWHANHCISYDSTEFSFCKNNMLCNCCKHRFSCYTKEYNVDKDKK